MRSTRVLNLTLPQETLALPWEMAALVIRVTVPAGQRSLVRIR